MTKRYELTTPVRVGDLRNGLTVTGLELFSFSMKALKGDQTSVLAIGLIDPASGQQEFFKYAGQEAVDVWSQVEPVIEQLLFAKLIADGKLPSGTLTEKVAP